MKKKKIFSLLLVATMTSSMLSACSSNSPNTTDDSTVETTETSESTEVTTKSPDELVTLTVLAGQSSTDAGIEDMIDVALAEKYPNIKLNWECVD
ncbi:hypothetical protein CG709_15870, partial [Lachnotalea glycerini]